MRLILITIIVVLFVSFCVTLQTSQRRTDDVKLLEVSYNLLESNMHSAQQSLKDAHMLIWVQAMRIQQLTRELQNVKKNRSVRTTNDISSLE